MALVRDIFQLPSFLGAEVVAGGQGLNRPIRWISVSERLDAQLMDGGEFLLTSGMRLRQAAAAEQEECIRTLVRCGGVGLGFDHTVWPGGFPPSLLEVSEVLGFPLVVWRTLIKFNAVTEEVSALLLNERYARLQMVDELTTALMQVVLSGAGVEDILACARRLMGRRVYLAPGHAGPRDLPADEAEAMAGLARRPLSATPQVALERGRRYAGAPLYVDGELQGTAWVEVVGAGRDHAWLLAERLATVVAWRLSSQSGGDCRLNFPLPGLAEDLLSGTVHEVVLRQRLALARVPVAAWHAVIVLAIRGVVGRPPASDHARAAIRYLMDLLSRRGARPCRAADAAPVTLVAVSLREERVRVAVTGHQPDLLVPACRDLVRDWERELSAFYPNTRLQVGIGRPRARLDQLADALQEAEMVIRFQEEAGVGREKICFEDVHLYRFLLATPPAELRRLVNDELGPLLALPVGEREELVATLETLLSENWNVAAAAKRLFLRRQSLYLRIDRLRSVLGSDIERFDRRTVLSLALRARDLTGYKYAADQREPVHCRS